MPRTRFKYAGTTATSAGEDERRCDHPSCGEGGLYRAPRARERLDSYFWFCLGHVREYNKAWNYYAGMSQDEVEAHIRADVVGWRPTWPVGCWFSKNRQSDPRTAQDPFGFFRGKEDRNTSHQDKYTKPKKRKPLSVEAKALSTMDLEPQVTLKILKSRYKELVKRFHPDANGGDKIAEEKLKLINQAYATLRKITSF